MEIKKRNKFVELMKGYGLYVVVGAIVFTFALTFSIIASLGQTTQTGTMNLQFEMPMTDAYIVKDFSNTELQNNETLNQWEAHLSVDLASENSDVFSILEGTVASVEYDFLDGYCVTINHSNGFVSIYSSLNENVLVEAGQKVSAGEKIGQASDSASGELELGSHLHLTMKLNNNYVDPNNYLNLQEK